jgi:hypothetical protein
MDKLQLYAGGRFQALIDPVTEVASSLHFSIGNDTAADEWCSRMVRDLFHLP